jgi:hypothetical protein
MVQKIAAFILLILLGQWSFSSAVSAEPSVYECTDTYEVAQVRKVDALSKDWSNHGQMLAAVHLAAHLGDLRIACYHGPNPENVEHDFAYEGAATHYGAALDIASYIHDVGDMVKYGRLCILNARLVSSNRRASETSQYLISFCTNRLRASGLTPP